MNSSLDSYLSKVTFGEMQQFENMGVIPIFSPLNECLDYITLSEALMNQLITVTEDVRSQTGAMNDVFESKHVL